MYLQAKPQLFLLHFAGGSCYSFEFLKQELNSDFDFIPLELPGRGKRHEEKLLLEKKQTIEDYFEQIKKLRNNEPYLVYGHSMGATLGFSLVHKMEQINDPCSALIVSGNPGPGVEKLDKQRYLMKDSEFKEILKTLGGVPDAVLENEELYSFFSPIMRADFQVLEKDEYSEEGLVINTPIIALMGDEEDKVKHIDSWRKFTTKDFSYNILPGNHFFIHNNSMKLSEIIRESCNYFLASNQNY